MGNHDEMSPDNQQWIKDNMDMRHPPSKSLLFQPETTDYRKQLPRQPRFQWENNRILLVYGLPTSNLEYLRPQTSHTQFSEHARQSKADIIIVTRRRGMGNHSDIYSHPARNTDNAVVERSHGVLDKWIEEQTCLDFASCK